MVFTPVDLVSFISICPELSADQWTEDMKFQEFDNIPDLPFLIAVPIGLRAQWELELHRYLKYGSLEIINYDSGAQKMPTFWTEIFGKSRTPLGKRIIIATTTVSNNEEMW